MVGDAEGTGPVPVDLQSWRRGASGGGLEEYIEGAEVGPRPLIDPHSSAAWLSGEKPQEDVAHWARIKFGLLSRGAVVTTAADEAMHDVKRPVRTRSGVSGGLDIRLDGFIDVNVPVREPYVQESPYRLDFADDVFMVRRDDDVQCEFQPLPTPGYYRRVTADGEEPMAKIGQMCSSDRFCYGMTGPTCFFWKSDRRCRYCTIGRNYSEDAARKQAKHLIEVLRAAVEDGRTPARHVLVGGGTPKGDDMGAEMSAELCELIKRHFPEISIYVMIAAPLENRHLDLLKSAGADEIGLNLEFWSDSAWDEFIPGKRDFIGKKRYLEALEHTVGLVGPVNTRSILIAGLEPLEATKAAALHLAEMGVMPIISPFRPLADAMLQDRRGPGAEEYFELWSEVNDALRPMSMPLGPACVACQNNTLALPTDSRYRQY